MGLSNVLRIWKWCPFSLFQNNEGPCHGQTTLLCLCHHAVGGTDCLCHRVTPLLLALFPTCHCVLWFLPGPPGSEGVTPLLPPIFTLSVPTFLLPNKHGSSWISSHGDICDRTDVGDRVWGLWQTFLPGEGGTEQRRDPEGVSEKKEGGDNMSCLSTVNAQRKIIQIPLHVGKYISPNIGTHCQLFPKPTCWKTKKRLLLGMIPYLLMFALEGK